MLPAAFADYTSIFNFFYKKKSENSNNISPEAFKKNQDYQQPQKEDGQQKQGNSLEIESVPLKKQEMPKFFKKQKGKEVLLVEFFHDGDEGAKSFGETLAKELLKQKNFQLMTRKDLEAFYPNPSYSGSSPLAQLSKIWGFSKMILGRIENLKNGIDVTILFINDGYIYKNWGTRIFSSKPSEATEKIAAELVKEISSR